MPTAPTAIRLWETFTFFMKISWMVSELQSEHEKLMDRGMSGQMDGGHNIIWPVFDRCKIIFLSPQVDGGWLQKWPLSICVCYFVHPSAERSCLRNFSYIFHQIHLKFCRLSSYDMKMCMWFQNFDSTIFEWVIVHADLNFANHDLVSTTPPTSFIGFIWNFLDFLPMIWRCAYGFRILIQLFLVELSPMLT